MNYYIITGTSRRLGEAITDKLLSENNYLICISRKKNKRLIDEAEKKNCIINYHEFDLEDLEEVDTLTEKIFTDIQKHSAESLCLINNAGLLDPIKPIGKSDSSEIIRNINVNAVAPMILTSLFINWFEDFRCKKVIVNITSGAGRNPYFGWGCYCSSKAAIDMYTRTIGVEQISKSNPVRIVSFAPGIIDTEMQKRIRQSSIEDFAQVERFRKFKEDGVLKEPSFVAQKVIEVIQNDTIKTGTVLDIKELINAVK